MARLSAPSELSAAQKPVAENILKSIPSLGGPYGAWIHRPELATRIHHLGDYFRGSNAVLPNRIRMIAVLMAIRHWGADYPWVAQTPNALNAGLSQDVVAAIAEGRTPDLADPKEQIAWQLANELLERRGISDATYRQARERLGDEVLVELVAAIGHFSLVSLTGIAFDIQPTKAPPVAMKKRA